MITFIYLLILSMMVGLIFVIDLLLMKKSFEDMFIFAISLEGGTYRWWIVVGLSIGLLTAMFSDFMEHKKKRQKGQDNGQ